MLNSAKSGVDLLSSPVSINTFFLFSLNLALGDTCSFSAVLARSIWGLALKDSVLGAASAINLLAIAFAIALFLLLLFWGVLPKKLFITAAGRGFNLLNKSAPCPFVQLLNTEPYLALWIFLYPFAL